MALKEIVYPSRTTPSEAAQESRPTPTTSPGAGSSPGGDGQGGTLGTFAWFGLLRSSDERRAGTGSADVFDRLASMAAPENWDGPVGGHGSLGVLKNYLTWTFDQAMAQEEVVPNADGQLCTFNTGLTTPRHEDIYGLFTPSSFPDRQPWVLRDWRLGHQLATFPELPGPPTYSKDPYEYFFDWDLPLSFSAQTYVDSISELFPGARQEIPYGLELALNGAVDRARAQATRNPGTAVPMWQPKKREIRLLLPLSLVTPGTPDAALAISRDDMCYRGVAILSLEKAYKAARLVTRPSAHWLTAFPNQENGPANPRPIAPR
ncbi:DUF3825 domain-containing protein [Streptomyces sp. NPDC058770]|uniref:DUF3825 domain-containing protein n=1 Tax=Streptomyces sp. NPDC058770 TaxID=3346631 RepID=UPI0036D0726C